MRFAQEALAQASARREVPLRHRHAAGPGRSHAALEQEGAQAFIDAGKELGIEVDPITRNDYARLAEYDGLFIRETTALGQPHLPLRQQARRSEGMVVIDDPVSILRCTNKIYLHDLLKSKQAAHAAHRDPVPRRCRSVSLRKLPEVLGLPMVLKIPDGSFSRGIIKVETRSSWRTPRTNCSSTPRC
jgi:glutathione synthase/RimK-type ligase-like ATP-grasp enzyme